MVVLGGLVRAHRDATPLLELVGAAFGDVAALVAFSLLAAEVDRSTGPRVAMSMLVSAALPGTSRNARALRLPSQTRWFFVVSPPRDSPIA